MGKIYQHLWNYWKSILTRQLAMIRYFNSGVVEFVIKVVINGGRIMDKMDFANPVYDDITGKAVWSMLYFGSYPQTEVKDINLSLLLHRQNMI